MKRGHRKNEEPKKDLKRAPKIWITVFTGNSGLTHYSYCLARALHQSGADVCLITNYNYELDFMAAGFPVIKLFHRSRYYPVDIIRFWRLYRRRLPDVVHYQSFLKFPVLELVLLKLQKRKGTRIIYTAHDWLPHHVRFYHKALFQIFYRAFDRVIVHSSQGERFLAEQLFVPREKMAVIPHGNYGFFATDPGLTKEAAREQLELDPERFWFLFFGRIDAHKGLDVALRALARTEGPGLIIAGDAGGGSLEEYRELIAELDIGERVKFFPGHIPVESVQVYFRAGDAVVLPYRESSTSGIVHLAMGLGLPVVASAVGGLTDVVEDGVTGLLVPPEDDEALAAAMSRLAGDEAVRRQLAEGWTAVEERYSWKTIAARTMAVYSS
ncbi:MAG: glycosyltransferase family 4 protein [Actinobacteria bacterium]|nr:glycosyltransferase family 4 protein [Actinomycetota bacterium]MCL5883327.1 glycosyltransferase family 4 protein [Actinomycetota bacterium]